MSLESQLLNLFTARKSISIDSAEQLSITTNTIPLIPSLSPRWLLRFLEWVDVETGIYRINTISYVSDILKLEFSKNKEVGLEVLKSINLFKNLPDILLMEVIEQMEWKETVPKEIIIKEGDVGDGLYIILHGEFIVSVLGNQNQSVQVKTLTTGDFFGEISLLENIPRQATITSKTQGDLIFLNKEVFKKIVHNPKSYEELKHTVFERKKELFLINQYGEVQAPLIAGQTGEPLLPRGFANLSEKPREIHLSSIQTIIGLHERIHDVYNVPYSQLAQQLRITIENMLEKEEWEIINNEDFGLLHNVDPFMQTSTREGPPTPDDLDALISLVWKQPTFFLAHPRVISAFSKECTRRRIPPRTRTYFGSTFLTWRGIPFIPTDKLAIDYSTGKPLSEILLMRVGQKNQGVIGLHKAKLKSNNISSLSVKLMNLDKHSIANYLLTKYVSASVQVPDALGLLKNVIVT